jgi:hypothetical protein
MKRESEPAALRKRFNEWKECNDKLTAKLKKECRDRRLQYYRIARSIREEPMQSLGARLVVSAREESCPNY